MTEKISVAMAVYRGERYLGEQLNTLFAQTRVPDEIVICDDSPDDRSEIVIRSFETVYPGVIRYFRNPERLGVSANFEKAVKLCTGDIIFLSDQDDFWLPQKIEKMAAILKEPNGGVFCDSMLTDEKLQVTGQTHSSLRGYSRRELKKLSAGTRRERELLFLKRFPGAGHNMAFRASLREVMLPFPDLAECHDSWIGYTVMLFSKWALCHETLTLFRQHEKNLSGMTKNRTLWAQGRLSCASGASGWYAKLFASLLKRAADSGRSLDRGLLSLIRKRLRYSQCRAALAGVNSFRRLPEITMMLLNGSYFRYGRGFLSAIQDLIFPSLFGSGPK